MPLTFNADNVIAYLLRYLVILDEVNEVVDCINRWMHALESLNFLANGQGVVQERVQVAAAAVAAPRTTRAP